MMMEKRRLMSITFRYVKVALIIFILSAIFTGTWAGCDKGTYIDFSATLDGEPWTGDINYKVEQIGTIKNIGPDDKPIWVMVEEENPDVLTLYTGKSVNAHTYGSPVTNTVTYISGGPPGALFQGMTLTNYSYEYRIYSNPSFIQGNTHTINIGVNACNSRDKYAYYYTFNFISTSVSVNAKLDSQDWSGPVAYSIEGPGGVSGTDVPRKHNRLSGGSYTLDYQSGGPDGAVLQSIMPLDINLAAGQGGTFTLNFITTKEEDLPPPEEVIPPVQNKVIALATLDGKPWSGPVNYTIGGPQNFSGDKVAQIFTGAAEGRYSLSYVSGGPENAVLSGISPGGINIADGGEAFITLEFISTGTIVVKGFVSAFEWEGPCEYNVTGPAAFTGDILAQSFTGIPLGEYTIGYISGGPPDTYYYPIEPETKTLNNAGDTLYFNMNFVPRWYQPIPPVVGAPGSSDLSLTLVAADAIAGAPTTYTITVTNSGPDTATGVAVTFALNLYTGGLNPLTYNGFTASQGAWDGPAGSNTGVWTIGTIASGDSVTLTVTVTIDPGASAGLDFYPQTAEISASGATDPDSVPNNGNPAEDDQSTDTLNIL